MKLYDYTLREIIDVAEADLTDDYAVERLIPQVQSAKAAYCVYRLLDADMELLFEDEHKTYILRAIRHVTLTALPGEVR